MPAARRIRPRSTLAGLGRSVLLVITCAGAAGCAGLAERTTREVVPAGVEGTLHALDDPENQAILRRLARAPGLQEAAHDFTQAIVGGALDGLGDEARAQKLRELSELYLREIAKATADVLRDELGPATSDAVNGVIAGAITTARRQQIDALVASVTRSAVAGFSEGAAEGIRGALGPALHDMLVDELGPALGEVIAKDLRPAIQETLSPATNAAVAGLVQEVAHAAVLGANEGLAELGLSPTKRAEDPGLGLFAWVAIILGLLVAILVLILVRGFMLRRNLERERARSERMLLNVLRTIQYTDSDDPERPPDLDEYLARARVDEDEDLAHVARVLARARRPSLIPGPGDQRRRSRDDPAKQGPSAERPKGGDPEAPAP